MGHGSSLGPNPYNKRSALGHAKGWGASGDGSSEWLLERISAFAAILPIFYMVFSLAFGMGSSLESMQAWFANPVNLTIAICGVLAAYTHGSVAVATVAGDYIHHDGYVFFARLIVKFGFIAMAVITIVSMLKLGVIGG